MEQTYPVTHNGKHTGKVLIQRQGLYYLFRCSCCLTEKGIYRLWVTCGQHQESLGILVPKDESFILDTKIPIKRIGEGNMSFFVVPKDQVSTATFVPISPEEPFAYISRLKESFLAIRDKQPGIYITQNQEHIKCS